MTFGVLIFPEVEELDFVGPWELLAKWRQVAKGPENCVLVAPTTDPVPCTNGLSVHPHVSFDTCPELQYLLVPGGPGTRMKETMEAVAKFVADRAPRCEALLSVCTGTFVLQAAGLLSGRRVTTHWNYLKQLRAIGDVTVVDARVVRDGPIWTAAGVSAGMDLMLAFIAAIADEKAAGLVQLAAEYYPGTTLYAREIHEKHGPRYLKNA